MIVSREPFHEGELEVQRRAGVASMAARVGGMIRSVLPPAAQEFLRSQTMLIAGAADERGALWATILTGAAGFAAAIDETRVHIDALPVLPRVDAGADIGLLAIELATRRRMRVNGVVTSISDRGFTVDAREVFSNCPKYITPRTVALPASNRAPSASNALSDSQRAWITNADTFFIATQHTERGADVSHRGGPPGFVQVSDDGSTLTWPDYQGNMMFQTLGNLARDDRAGLLLVDFTSGSTLQLTGHASIEWSGEERAVMFRVRNVVETRTAA